MTDKADNEAAIKRIANTQDGKRLRRYLQLVVNELPPGGGDSGALYLHAGRRSFAHELKRLLEQGLTESERESGRSSGITDPDEPVAESRREPVARISRGLARRVPTDPDAA